MATVTTGTATVMVNGKPVTGDLVSQVDDFTGKVLAAEDFPVKVEFTLNGKPVKLDAAKAMADIFAAFITSPTDENRRAFGAVIPRPKVGASASGTAKDADKSGTSKRDYLRANGYPNLAERGKFTEEMNDKWAGHLADESKTGEKAAA